MDRFICTDDGVRLAVREYGGDGPPLVKIHGFFGNLGQFDIIGPTLAEHYRVVAYDQRGHGWSESGPTSIDTYVEDLRAVIEALELDTPVLYGSSFGSLVALAAMRAGQRTRGFVNEDGHIGDWPEQGPGAPPQPDGSRILGRNDQQPYIEFWARWGATGTATAMRSMQARRDGRVELRPTQTELNGKGLAFSELPILDCYRAIDVPVLLLAAAREDTEERVERDNAIDRLGTICACDVRKFPTDHWITADDPTGVAEALAEFARAL